MSQRQNNEPFIPSATGLRFRVSRPHISRRPDYFSLLLWFVRLAVPSLMLAAMLYLDRVNHRIYLEQVRADVLQEMGVIRAELEGSLSANLQTVRGLVAAIATEPDMKQQRFSELAKVVLDSRPQLRNVGAAPDLVMQMIYPLQGNKAALGLDFRSNTEQFPAVQKAAEEGQLVLDGPINLVQGGQAFIGRIPVFVSEGERETSRFWGVISAVIDIDQLYKDAGLLNHPNLAFALKNTSTPNQKVFFGSPILFADTAVTMPIAVPGSTWQLAGQPAGGWPHHATNTPWIRTLLALIFLAVVTPVLWLTWSLQRQRLTQQRLQALFNLSPIGIALNDFDTGAFIEANDALIAPTGYSREEFFQLPFWQFTPLQYREREEEQLRLLQHTGRYGPYEKEYVRKSGDTYPVRLNGMLVHDSGGRLLIWSIIEDISERKRIERMKTDFVSTVSHELRTPLTSITGALGLLRGGALGELSPGMVDVINIADKNSRQLTLLINDLLDMDKLMSGKLRFHSQWHTLASLLEQYLQANRPYAEQYDVSLVLEDKAPTALIYVDPARLEQVMANLLSNAIKFSPEGSQVSITSEQLDDIVRISVEDQGAGVPRDFQKHLFQKFSQADSSDTRAKGGTGLGLAISRELVERMNGHIGYHGRSGGGACFYVELPAGRG